MSRDSGLMDIHLANRCTEDRQLYKHTHDTILQEEYMIKGGGYKSRSMTFLSEKCTFMGTNF